MRVRVHITAECHAVRALEVPERELAAEGEEVEVGELERGGEYPETGVTGLEPATPGATGRSWCNRPGRGYAVICGESRSFRPWACGEWRVPAGASGDLLRDLCGMLTLSQMSTEGR